MAVDEWLGIDRWQGTYSSTHRMQGTKSLLEWTETYDYLEETEGSVNFHSVYAEPPEFISWQGSIRGTTTVTVTRTWTIGGETYTVTGTGSGSFSLDEEDAPESGLFVDLAEGVYSFDVSASPEEPIRLTGKYSGKSKLEKIENPVVREMILAMVESMERNPTSESALVSMDYMRNALEDFMSGRLEEETPPRLPGRPGPLSGSYSSSRHGVADTMKWSLSPGRCPGGEEEVLVSVQSPGGEEYLVFDAGEKSSIQGKAIAKVTEKEAEDLVEWRLPRIAGKSPETDPPDARGYWINFTYRGMPKDNATFGDEESFTARIPPYRACLDLEPREGPARVRFDRDGAGNPEGTVPNWLYYWSLTLAGQGMQWGHDYFFDDSCNSADEGKVTLGHFDGYFDAGAVDFFYVCDGAQEGKGNVVTGRATEGIDTFASTLRHERTHRTNYHRWWKKFYDRWRDDRDFKKEKRKIDRDRDFVPDREERALGLNPRMRDTHHTGYDDEEYLAYKSESEWRIGEADEEDWACPGKQCR